MNLMKHKSADIIKDIIYSQLKSIISVFENVLIIPVKSQWVDILNITASRLPFLVIQPDGIHFAQVSIDDIDTMQLTITAVDEEVNTREWDSIWESLFNDNLLERAKFTFEERITAINTVASLTLFMSLYMMYTSFVTAASAKSILDLAPDKMFLDNKVAFEVSIGTMARTLVESYRPYNYNIFVRGIPIYDDNIGGVTMLASCKKVDVSTLPPHIHAI